MSSNEKYQEAYSLHYKKKDYRSAFIAYLYVIQQFPSSPEAKYSWQQLQNIVKVVDIKTISVDDALRETYDAVIDKFDLDEAVAAEKRAKELSMREQEKKEAMEAERQLTEYDTIFTNKDGVPGLFGINDEHRKWAVIRRFPAPRNGHYYDYDAYDYSDLINYEVVENGNSVQSGRGGSAALGYLAFGVAGAIIGSSMAKENKELISDLHISISVRDLKAPNKTINLLSHAVDNRIREYKDAIANCEKIVAILRYIMNENANKERVPARAIYAFSVADEITKFKRLCDDGIITPDEFEQQKKKLLALDY